MARGQQRRKATSRKRRIAWRIILSLCVLIFVLCAYMLLEAQIVHLVYAEVQLRDLPQAFDGAKLLFVSDLHIDFLNPPERVARLMGQLNQLEPDLMLFGGDYTSFGLDNSVRQLLSIGKLSSLERRESAMRDGFFRAIGAMEPPLGKFGVLGNHDSDASGVEESLALGGVKLLVNQCVRVQKDGQTLVIAGIDDWNTGVQAVDKLAAELNGSECVILLSHNPDALPVVSNQPAADGVQWADLMLCGHTHGGQVRPFGRTVIVPSKYGDRYLSGWRRESGTELLVSNGVGTTGLPFRLGAPAQAHLITLRCAPE